MKTLVEQNFLTLKLKYYKNNSMILMNNFSAEPSELREASMTAVRRVVESGCYILGNEGSAFEDAWARICGLDHGIGVANGMDAIEVALRALEIGPGHEVITTPMTAFATILAIIRAGATPVLADIDRGSGLLSLESVSRCWNKNTKAVVLVHLYGQVRSMDRWVKFCSEKGVHFIEDCAQSHLASWGGRTAGSFGIAGAYSFYPTKNLGALGDAGMLVTSDLAIKRFATQLRNYGQSEKYFHPLLGLNSRLDELQAAVLTERLKWLPRFTARRQKIAAAYRLGIEARSIDHLSPPEEMAAHVYHLFVIKTQRRKILQEYLASRGVQSAVHYPIPIHWQKPCLDCKRDPLGLSTSEKHAEECLSIPCHPQMSDSEVDRVVEVVNSFG